MKKEITFGQVLSIGVTVVLALFTAWVSVNKRLSTLEAKQADDRNQIYTMQIAIDKKYDNLSQKIDNLTNATTQILVNLERKQDRK